MRGGYRILSFSSTLPHERQWSGALYIRPRSSLLSILHVNINSFRYSAEAEAEHEDEEDDRGEEGEKDVALRGVHERGVELHGLGHRVSLQKK